jgi:hypothetical protein
MSMPVLKLRQVVGFPGSVYGGNGVDVSKANGNYTIETDWSGFPSLSTTPSSPTNSVLSYDTLTGVYALLPTGLLTGVIGTVDAGDLIGATLASNVLNSSLHTVGTLTGGATGSGFTINLSASAVTGTLPIANGGTGATTAAAALSALGALPLAGGTLSGPLILAADPVAALGAVTKQYVDNIATGLSVKSAVRLATTVAGTLASSFENGDTIDGVALVTGNRILIKNQAAPAENGIYTVNASGAPTRATDLDAWSEAIGAYTFVTAGSTQSNTGWVTQVAAGGTINTTAMPWGQFSSQASYTAGPGVSLVGTNFLLDTGSVTNSMLAAPVSVAKGGTGQDFSASTGIPLFTAGAASVLSTTGTGTVVRSASPTITGTLTGAAANFSGNVGIGTASPLTKLHVDTGQVALTNASNLSSFYATGSQNEIGLNLNNTQSGGKQWIVASAATASTLGAGLHYFNYTDSQDNLWLDNFGNTWVLNLRVRHGSPWADVKAWGAVGDGSANDQPAIQAAINYLIANFGGGTVFFPPGNYRITSTIMVPGSANLTGAVILEGCGQRVSHITAITDITLVQLGDINSNGYCGIKNMSLFGYQNAAATANAVYIYTNIPAIIRDVTIFGGNFALQNDGCDSCIENVYLNGWGPNGGGIKSFGANWYIRVKSDSGPQAVGFAFLQGAFSLGAGVAENHFTQCDFSGNHTYSIYIDDGAEQSSTAIFEGCVMSGPTLINSAKWTCFSACEFGNAAFAVNNTVGGDVTVANSISFGGFTIIGGSANLHLSNNVNIS